MTAAHCVTFKSSVQVVAGAYNLKTNETSRQKIVSKRIIVHPAYDKRRIESDIALVELSAPLRLNDRVGKPCMPQQDVYPRAGENCYIAGKKQRALLPFYSFLFQVPGMDPEVRIATLLYKQLT